MESLLQELRIAIAFIDEMEDEMEFIPIARSILDRISQLPNSFEAVEKILKIIEENEDTEYGGPGPLGHFLESFYKRGYEEQLVQSLKRKPRFYTLFLLQRCINDPENENRKDYLQLMNEMANNPEVSEEIRAEARESVLYFKTQI